MAIYRIAAVVALPSCKMDEPNIPLDPLEFVRSRDEIVARFFLRNNDTIIIEITCSRRAR